MDYVLYWARVSRRADSNCALEAAVRVANELGLPVLFYEELPCAVAFASLRFHTFALEGVPDTARRLRKLGIGYAFYLPRRCAEPQSMIGILAARAAAVLTDEDPLAPAVSYETVDSSCIVPSRLIESRCYAAYSLRPKINKLLPRYLKAPTPLEVRRRFRFPAPTFHTEVTPDNIAELAASCEVDRSVSPSTRFRGGRTAALAALERFLDDGLARYARDHRDPALHATSGLSPWLNLGHIGALEVALAAQDRAARDKLIAGEFLEELIVRRELAWNFCRYTQDPRTLAALPPWARQTLEAHARDHRPALYTAGEFEQARTHDRLWNAAQRELLATGVIHGYYRMYWGKKLIEWSRSPAEALDVAIRLNDRYALDGRSPNGYANILWCFGLHDRPWPEREIFGTVRWMSSGGIERKTDAKAYLREIASLA